MMNALAALLAAPAAEAALGLARSGAAAVAQPFELLLKAAAERAEGASNSTSRDRDETEEGESIRERLAGKLQELMAAIGGAAGVASDAVTLRLDEITGAVQVGDDHPLAETLEAEFAADPQIAADLARLAELEGDDAEWQFEPAA